MVGASEHRHQGNRYHVHAAVTLRNRELEIARALASSCSHADSCVAVDHTFDTLCRRGEAPCAAAAMMSKRLPPPVQATVRTAKKTAVFW